MADTLDILTLAEAKSVLHIGPLDAANDGAVARVVTAVSRAFDQYIGPTVRRSVTSERLSGGRHLVELAWCPVYAISSVVEYQGTSAVTMSEDSPGVESSDGWYGERYKPDPSLYSGLLARRYSGHDACWWQGHGNVVVTYTAGRSESTGTVDARIKEACAIALRNYWRSYESTILTGVDGEFDMPAHAFPTMGLPDAAKALVKDLAQPYVGFG